MPKTRHLFPFAAVLAVCLLGAPAAGAGNESVPRVPPRSSAGTGGRAGTFPNEVIDVDGVKREYRLVVPKDIDPQTPVPLLFAFHGFLIDSKDLMPVYTRLDTLAAEKKCILVYPNARNRAWPLFLELAQPDLQFFDALYKHVTARYNVDLNRVYLCGMSNGGYFTHVVASQRPDKVAAICCHSGGMGLLALRDLNVTPKYAVLAVHGADDPIVRVEEGRRIRDYYTRRGHPVEYVEVPGLKHIWAVSADINPRMWDFFLAHPLPGDR